MVTPTLFLDEASRSQQQISRHSAEQLAVALIQTLRRLKKANKKISLNTCAPIADHLVSANWSLQAILGGTAFRDEWTFIRELVDRSPFSTGFEYLDKTVLEMDFRTKPSGVRSVALAWASVLETATVSFAGHADWAKPWVDIEFDALDDQAAIVTTAGTVRNASQDVHVATHEQWLKSFTENETINTALLWENRGEYFPGLRFLARVEEDLARLATTGAAFKQAVQALKDLSKDVTNWKQDQPWPEISGKNSPESQSRASLCKFWDEKLNEEVTFEWHVRFTGAFEGRVHFCVDTENRSLTVAYVGYKLLK